MVPSAFSSLSSHPPQILHDLPSFGEHGRPFFVLPKYLHFELWRVPLEVFNQ